MWNVRIEELEVVPQLCMAQNGQVVHATISEEVVNSGFRGLPSRAVRAKNELAELLQIGPAHFFWYEMGVSGATFERCHS